MITLPYIFSFFNLNIELSINEQTPDANILLWDKAFRKADQVKIRKCKSQQFHSQRSDFLIRNS